MDLGRDPIELTFPPSLADWVEGERLALGAAVLRSLPGTRMDIQRAIFERMWPDRKLAGSRPAEVERMRQLPPSALEGLASLTPDQRSLWEEYAPLWAEALRTAKWDNGSRRSPVAGAKLIANRLTKGALKSAQFPRLARLELRREWNDTPDLRLGLRRLMDDLRKAQSTADRIDALSEFRKRAQPPRWRMVENAILQQSFAWPLLVLQPTGGNKTYCSLPVIVDVRLNAVPVAGRDEVELKQFETPAGGSHLIEASAWKTPIRRALNAAKDLWGYKHPGCHRAFRRMINNASVTIDLRVAEAVVAPYRDSCRFSFDGESLEVYLALVILGHFLNSQAMEAVCATGTIAKVKYNGTGKDRQDHGSDRWIGQVDGVSLKAQCVADGFFFDQIIVPRGSAPENPPRRLKISEGTLLSHYADHVFGDDWRRHRWVRCPDLAAGFKAKDLTDVEESEIGLILQVLRSNTERVVELHHSISALGVARALKRVNDLTAQLPEREGGSRRWERQGSYTIIRTVEQEINERFWQVVWDALSADPAQFEPFCNLVSVAAPGSTLAGELNRFLPDEYNRKRAPDVLVIVGSDRLIEATTMPTGPFSRLQIGTVMKAAARVLNPSPIGDLKRFIGSTRIILVPKDWASAAEMPVGAAPPHLQRAVRRLSVFRHGFTFPIARRMLNLDEASCLDTLRALQEPRADGRPWLSYGVSKTIEFPPDAAYEYYFTEKAALPAERDSLAALHFDAANAIVGFLEPLEDAARFNFETAFSPVWLHEAQHHFSRAWQNRDPTHKTAPQERERLSRVGEPFSWSAVRWAAKFSKERDTDILEAVKEHLAQKHKRRETVHPIELVWAAKLSFKLQRDGKGDDDFRRKVLSHAWAACAKLPSPAEQEACKFVVATTRAVQKMQISPNERGLGWARQDNDDALERLPNAQEILDPEWFEYIGDAETDNLAAARLYRRAIWDPAIKGAEHSGGGGAFMKYLGACAMSKTTPDAAILEQLRATHSPGMNAYICDHDRAAPSGLISLADRKHCWLVHERWRLGREQYLAARGKPSFGKPPVRAASRRRDVA